MRPLLLVLQLLLLLLLLLLRLIVVVLSSHNEESAGVPPAAAAVTGPAPACAIKDTDADAGRPRSSGVALQLTLSKMDGVDGACSI